LTANTIALYLLACPELFQLVEKVTFISFVKEIFLPIFIEKDHTIQLLWLPAVQVLKPDMPDINPIKPLL
jgi:hypothetical protein